MTDRLEIIPRTAASRDLLLAASRFEERFAITFEAFAVFSSAWLEELYSHASERAAAPAEEKQLVVQPGNHMLSEISALANKQSPTMQDRKRYLDTFLDIYRGMQLADFGCGSITAAPKREGLLLARELSKLPSDVFAPHLKRIPWESGLAIGIEYLPILRAKRSCQIIDGAVASGATVLALMEMLTPLVDEFKIDLSPIFHPSEVRARTSFEPCWLGGATGWGAEPR